MDMLKTLLKYFKPHRKLFILDMCCAIMASAVDLSFPLVSRYAMLWLFAVLSVLYPILVFCGLRFWGLSPRKLSILLLLLFRQRKDGAIVLIPHSTALCLWKSTAFYFVVTPSSAPW